MFAGEQSRVMAFYVPALGPAPRLVNSLFILLKPHPSVAYAVVV